MNDEHDETQSMIDGVLDQVESDVVENLKGEVWWALMNPQQQHRVKVFAVVQRMFGMSDGARNAAQQSMELARMHARAEQLFAHRAIQYAMDEGVDLVGVLTKETDESAH